MMWKTLIILALISVVLGAKTNKKRHTEYKFEIKHDYSYLKHHDKAEHDKGEIEETPQETEAVEQEEIKEEEPNEEVKSEPEEPSESGAAITEPEEPVKEQEPDTPNYEFLYKVIDPHTHDKKGQHEKKYDGEVKGVYWLLQPDGYKRTVDYYTDKHNGFHAKVDYSKAEEPSDEEDSKAKSEYYISKYHGKKYIPVKEEPEEEQEVDRQEESAQHIPIYVI